ncbi:MAG: hypothetical protein JSV33_06915 [bacterium]|nr:MAG: hypothetical protein JSV33_06915 [bacterium]
MRTGSNLRKLILTALFTVLSVVLGYLLAAVPNVELITLTVFLSGIFLGRRLGALVGCLSILIYSLFNPFGPALPPLVIAQAAGFALVGWTGGALQRLRISGDRESVLISACAGLLLTFVYDLLTTVATAVIALGGSGFLRGFGGVFIAGLIFMAIHAVSNTVIFGVAVTPILRVAGVWERGGV